MKIMSIIVAIMSIIKPANADEVWASYYSESHGTASGEKFNPNAYTAAHRYFKFGTKLRIQYRGKTVLVRINDRGPFVKSRQLDLSIGAARAINCAGVCRVSMNVVE